MSVAAAAGLYGCTSPATPASEPTVTKAPADGAVQRWRASQDDDALRELVDAHVDPAWCGRASKADVRPFTGTGIDDPERYPNAGPNWVYPSVRPVPVGSSLCVEFTDDGIVPAVTRASK